MCIRSGCVLSLGIGFGCRWYGCVSGLDMYFAWVCIGLSNRSRCVLGLVIGSRCWVWVCVVSGCVFGLGIGHVNDGCAPGYGRATL